jgi:hypothetical protein
MNRVEVDNELIEEMTTMKERTSQNELLHKETFLGVKDIL